MENIEELKIILRKYKSRKKNNKNTNKTVTDFVIKKQEISDQIDKYSKDEQKEFKYICEEFNLIKKDKNYSVSGTPIIITDKKTNTDLLKESKQIAQNTTNTLRQSMQNINDSTQIAENSIVIIKIDNDKLDGVIQNTERIDSDIVIAKNLITNVGKRLYTDKIIISCTCATCVLIVLILLYKYKII